MFHHCGCSAFITNLAYLIIDQNNAWIRGAGFVLPFSAGKFQVGRWKANAFGQGLTFCSGSTPLAILIVGTQTSPFQYLMFSSLFSLIIQLTVIFPWTRGAATGSVGFPLTRPNLVFTAPRRAAPRGQFTARFKRANMLKRWNMWRLHCNSMSREVEMQKGVGSFSTRDIRRSRSRNCSWVLLSWRTWENVSLKITL